MFGADGVWPAPTASIKDVSASTTAARNAELVGTKEESERAAGSVLGALI